MRLAKNGEELIELFREGNERAFDEIYRRYSLKLRRLVFFYTGDNDTTDDVLHDVFIRVFRHLDKFNISMSFSSWIYQIAVNCSKNTLKKRQRVDDVFDRVVFNVRSDDDKASSPEDEVLKDIDLLEFSRAVGSLHERFRSVFILRFDHNRKYSDISEILNCSERTAKWRMKKAIELITDYLRDRKVI